MKASDERATPPTRVVVLGGGFAGIAAARALERASTAVDVTLVNIENFTLFTPMLPEVASGALDMRSVVQPIRVLLRRTTFVLGEACGLDVEAKTVRIRHSVLGTESSLAFDHLVIALGAETSTFGIPGVAEHAYPLKSLPDAGRIRARIVGMFEAAAATTDRLERDRLLRFVIVGGGFTGVEAAGEIDGFLRRLRPVYPALAEHAPEIVLVEGEKRLLAHLSPAMGAYAARSLRDRNVRLELGERVASADATGLALANGSHIASATIIWTAGVEPAPFVKSAGLRTGKHGALVVNADCSVPGLPGIWGVGDCAAVPTGERTTAAPLAQTALYEGPLAARNILATIAGRKTKRFRYRVRGMTASLGNHDAVFALPGNRLLTGVPAWLAWRAFYLTRLPGLSRKMRVAADWTLTEFAAPNVARLPWISERLAAEDDHAAEG